MTKIIKELEQMLNEAKKEFTDKQEQEAKEFYPFELTQERFYLDGVTSGLFMAIEKIKQLEGNK